MSQALVSARWDAEYREGRYAGEPPLPFVDRILATIHASSMAERRGLYIGCGNGRNYLPLVRSGLHLYGLDLSAEALRQLAAREPALAKRLICTDFRTFVSRCRFSYVIAIQVFQHGVAADVAGYFAGVGSLLSPGGLFFLRVNAASTQVRRPHTVIERNDSGGFTIRYESGPKQGLPVHFLTRDELHTLTRNDFAVVAEPREGVAVRTPPETGHWVQWEAIWKRLDGKSAWRGRRNGP
ncbi:class I SAM-dependent methyltransferase [Candidatus Palauibacter sp.]|uniref:class I SAM-dependent methyltransferase n=1 Tax=Candidatus Palauibacter sp. TaxID=3101350 RepID=UPI003B52E426